MRRPNRKTASTIRSAVILAATAGLGGEPAHAQITERVSLATGGAQGFGNSGGPTVSDSGRFVAFHSLATSLVPGDVNAAIDVFVRDRVSGTTELISLSTGGVPGNSDSFVPSMSSDGRFVAYYSHSTNLVAGDTNGAYDIYVRDRQAATTERVNVSSAGAQANTDCQLPAISGDGRFVAFQGQASNLVAGDTNGAFDVFVRDRTLATTVRASVATGGAQGNGNSDEPAISADGRFVAFQSLASNLVVGDTNAVGDVFVHDLVTGTTERVSISSAGVQGNASSVFYAPSISADGRFVAFQSNASNLVAGDTNGTWDVFVRDRLNGTTERVSVAAGGVQANFGGQHPSISDNGRFVAFESVATNLVPGDTNGTEDVFLRDRLTNTIERISLSTAGVQGNFFSYDPEVSGDGRFVVFSSDATTLVAGDTNAVADAMLRDRDATDFTSFCFPGISGVAACPCANPPGVVGLGCNNSVSTGGALLSASGATYLTADTLVFTTNGELATATSIVLQGNAQIPAGSVFGQGVRCVGGALKRLYVKTASGGSITAPNTGAGDLAVSARSAQLGDPISPGESRYYLVYYRDPVVSGGCPAASTFNATQSGAASWWP